MSVDLAGLNQSQQEAVMWDRGPLLVLAGPGSGKTRVLTYRVARLIDSSPEARFRVLGITFTNKAAAEMRTRVDALLSRGRDRATLTTFHSFAAEVLRQHGSHVGLKPDFAILSEQADREAVLADAIAQVEGSEEAFEPRANQILPIITRMLDECIAPSGAFEWLGRQPHARALADIYVAYRDRLIRENHLDFGSLLAMAIELLQSKPAIAKQIQRAYSFVCVDEFQDTNAAQCKFLEYLVSPVDQNVFVVADDDQLIYQWNGASPARLQALRDRYGMKVVQLPQNYRCPPQVVAIANELIQHNTDRAREKKPLQAYKPDDGQDRVRLRHFAEFDEERRWLGELFLAMKPEKRAQCVVLARRRRLLEEVVSELESVGVPAYIAVRKNEFESPPFRWLHAVLRLANAPNDREQLRRVGKAYFQLEGVNLETEDTVARASVEGISALRAWCDMAEERSDFRATTQMLASLRAGLVERLDYWAVVMSAHEWFEAIQQRGSSPEESAFDEYGDEKEVWRALVAEIGTHYALPDLSLHNFLQELDLRAKEKPAPKDAVRCLTIASSKGLEFREVFLVGLVEDELPSYYARKKGDASQEMLEERRNCFVAITRAEEILTLTYSDRYFGFPKEPSRFLDEMNLLR